MLYVKFITGCLATALLLGGCTKETEQKGTNPVTPDTDNTRQEVLMTLRNQLVLQKNATKADATAEGTGATKAGAPIATAAENAISTLDVYVFGAKTEDGDYSYLERFAYRADAKDKLPQRATELQLNASGTDGKETTALMKLKKGLFVKLYCIANDTTLIDPAADKVIKPADFTSIAFTEGEDGTPRFANEGVPLESTFTTWHTRLLTATAKADTLVTPLAMAGAYTTPVDLTTFDNAARIQIGFRLTRLAARFDIDNKAGVSRFSIETVSMGNGRRGSGFFPIRVYGDLPQAKTDQLITYPEHAMYGKNANDGLATSAFYAYPSPKQDKAFLILKGKYKVNETEMKQVSYQIPFMQQTADGNAAWFDIANNHRYTVAITKADDYHLDAYIRVADWADDGSIEYTPDNKPGEIVVTVPDAFKDDTEYDKETKVVSMSLVDGSNITLTTTTNSALSLTKTYAGGISGEKYDWMEISEPAITPVSNRFTQYTYTISLKKGYTTGRYPRTTIRLRSLTDGSENILFIEALAVPKPIETKQPSKAPNGISDNPNSFNPETLEASIYRITDSRTQVKITCPDGVEIESKPDWLDITQASQSGAETTFDLVLNDRDVVVPGNQGTLIFYNKKKAALKINVTVTLLAAPVKPAYDAIGTENIYTPATTDPSGNTLDDIQLSIKTDNKTTVRVASLDGVTIKIDYPHDSPQWLQHNGINTQTKAATVNGKIQDIVFEPIQSKVGGAKKATITLKNIIEGTDSSFTLTPLFLAPTLKFVEASAVPAQNSFAAATNEVNLYKASDSKLVITAYSLGGNVIEEPTGVTVTKTTDNYDPENKYTVTWDNKTESGCYFYVVNKSDNTKKTKVIVNILDSSISPSFTNLGGTNNSYTAGTGSTPGNVNMAIIDKNFFNITTKSVGGVTVGMDFDGGPAWLTQAGTPVTKAGDNPNEMKFTLNTASLTNGQAKKVTVTLKNLSGKDDYKFTITPVFPVPAVAFVSGSNSPAQNSFAGTTATLYQVAGSKVNLKATNLGGAEVKNATGVTITNSAGSYATDNTFTVTLANENTTAGSFEIVNKSEPAKSTKITLSVPQYTAPVVTYANGNVPSQNTMSGSTIKLYRVSNSKVVIKASSLGGTYVKTQTGVNVTGGNNLNTDNNYTVTWNGSATTGSFVIANKTDIRRTTTISLNLADPAITASNLSVKAANSGNTNISVTSPEGVTAAVLNNNWNGGGQWFDISTNQTTGSGAKNIVITQRNNINTVMKAVTIRLTNKIAGGASKDITVTPNGFVAPVLSETSKTFNDFNTTAVTFTVSSAGSSNYVSMTNEYVASVSKKDNTYTVSLKNQGTTVITIANASSTNLKSTYTLKVNATKNYNGKTAYAYGNYLIAPEDAASQIQKKNLDKTICSKQKGAIWRLPTSTEWRIILGVTGDDILPSSSDLWKDWRSKNLFVLTPGAYASMTEYIGADNETMRFFEYGTNVSWGYVSDTTIGNVRCITDK